MGRGRRSAARRSDLPVRFAARAVVAAFAAAVVVARTARAEGDCAVGWTGDDCDVPTAGSADATACAPPGAVEDRERPGPWFEVLSESPRIYAFPRFLSDAEIDWMRE